MYVNALHASGEVIPPTVCTVTLTVPNAPAGETHVISVSETTTTLVAATRPNRTIAPGKKLVPVSVTAVPPVDNPVCGLIGQHVGGIAYTAGRGMASRRGGFSPRICSADGLSLSGTQPG